MLIKFKRIDDLRTDNDLKIREIAKILDISIDNYFDYANGRSNFPLEKLNILANYFKVSFDYITGLSHTKKEYPGNINLDILKQELNKLEKKINYPKKKPQTLLVINNQHIGTMKAVILSFPFLNYIYLPSTIMFR